MKKMINVNKEYMEAFRTKSYVEILAKMQTSSSGRGLSELVLEPPQSTVDGVVRSSRLGDALLAEYFQASSEACDICQLLLRSVHLVRENCHKTLLENPFAAVDFRSLHDKLNVLFGTLKTEKRKNRRKAKLMRLRKVVAGGSLVLTCTVVASAMLVPALHTVVGLFAFAAAPGLAGLSRKAKRREETTSCHHRSEQLGLAAKGVYILIKGFDTLGRLAQRVWDQVDHSRVVADLCMGNGRRSGEMAKELASLSQQPGFLDLLEELEEHVYLCVVDINRFRKLLIRQILHPTDQNFRTTNCTSRGIFSL